jgi:hypothetical protein
MTCFHSLFWIEKRPLRRSNSVEILTIIIKVANTPDQSAGCVCYFVREKFISISFYESEVCVYSFLNDYKMRYFPFTTCRNYRKYFCERFECSE